MGSLPYKVCRNGTECGRPVTKRKHTRKGRCPDCGAGLVDLDDNAHFLKIQQRRERAERRLFASQLM